MSTAAQPAMPAADRRAPRILVVDDERSMRELLAIVLRREGYEVMLAENGSIMEFSRNDGKITGKAPVGYVYVDGTTVGDVGNVVVRDRQMLARDGILMVVVSVDRTTGTLRRNIMV